ncbi:uncharacterized protein LOC121596170 isoform X2 [Anopheles merus]|uniref:uncharacterized protein LOC121596170 isoform X2 n=1 Tax=Anopheles merus TaxID=30066 RepID=UPI001BE408BB|nr:uncharacterized protein LOC121596170 isoform X2 [Anopheles merus]
MANVVRLGDSGKMQEIKIAEAVRHPEYREGIMQHDIALLRLQSKVELDSTVVPACLWNNEDLKFHVMDLVSWSGSDASDVVKTQVRPTLDGCDRMQSTGLCVESTELDSCLDGGFLQVPLNHNGKVTPFVVAIGAPSNVSCQKSTPTPYTKVSSYVQWIVSTIQASGEPAWEWKFKEAECALRYVHLRQYQKQVLIDQTDSLDVVTPARRRLEPRYTDAMVEIRYGGYSVSREDCYGLIIDEDTVLTLAQCTTNHGKRATFVMYMGNERNTVVKHYNHPGYREGQYYNNIGLLKVRSRFVFFGSFVPFCIWHESDLADSIVELTGHGRRDLNYFSLHNASVDVFEPQNFQLVARANVLPINKCSYPEEFSSNLSNGLTGEHLCFGNEAYLVPETCQQAAGGPIGGKKFKFNKQFRYAYALNSFGRDCGFGRAAVGVRLSSHIGWLQSVLLPDYRKDSGSVHFLHSELEENDTCRHVDGAAGLCVEATRCPKIRYDFSANRRVVFCQTSTVVCCPYENMVNETTASGRELDECADRIKASCGNTNEAQFDSGYITEPNLVEVGWRGIGDTKAQWSCKGTLITSNAVLASAKCLQQQSFAPSVIRLGLYEAAPVVNVEETILHPEFDVASGKNNIALIKMRDAIDRSTIAIHPACLWKNQTHTPFEMIQPVINGTTDSYVYPTAMYNRDCEALEEGLSSNQLCVDVQPHDTKVSLGDLLFWSEVMDDGTQVQYLVGIMSHVTAGDHTVNVHSRISSYVGWIKSML